MTLEEKGNIIDGEYPLLFRTQGDGDVTIDISVYTGEDYYDNAKYIEDDFEYIGSITIASVGDGSSTTQSTTQKVESTTQKAKITTEKTTETTTEIAPETTAKTTVYIQIGKPYLTVNGENTPIDSPAFISGGYTMLPIRAVSAAIGISDSAISYSADTKTASLSRGGINVSVSCGDDTIYIDGAPKHIDSPAVIENGRMYLPLRALAQALNINDIDFDTVSKTVTIKY